MPLSFHETLYWLPEAPDGGNALKLFGAGVTHPDPAYQINRPNGSEHYVWEMVLAGEGELFVGKDFHATIHAGDAYILAPGTPHRYYATPGNPWQKLWFNIGGRLPEKLLEAYQLQHTITFLQCPAQNAFQQALAIVAAGGERVYDRLGAALLEIVQILSTWQLTHNRRHTRPRSAEALQLKQFLDQSLQELPPPSLAMIAEQIHRSPAQMLRIFRQAWDTSPGEYIQRKRIELACQYLENTELPIREIARRIGFQDEFYFSNFFKRRLGLAPKFYRKRFRHDKPAPDEFAEA